MPITKDAYGKLFSRKDFVLAPVNKEGGAHVDPEIKESYDKIANLNSLGWTYSEGSGGKALTSTPDSGGANRVGQARHGPAGPRGVERSAAHVKPGSLYGSPDLV